MGVGGKRQVYLDLSHLERGYLERKLGGIIEIYRKFVGEDPAEVPMRIFPGVHYSRRSPTRRASCRAPRRT
jgi:succinate dehydrogenase / fumarate reductase flavoprotein subunit